MCGRGLVLALLLLFELLSAELPLAHRSDREGLQLLLGDFLERRKTEINYSEHAISREFHVPSLRLPVAVVCRRFKLLFAPN